MSKCWLQLTDLVQSQKAQPEPRAKKMVTFIHKYSTYNLSNVTEMNLRKLFLTYAHIFQLGLTYFQITGMEYSYTATSIYF